MTDTQPQTAPLKNYRLILFVAAFSAFLATFNETFLNVSFDAVMRDFGIGVGSVQWLATAYMLGAAVMVPVSAFLYRSIRTKPLYLFTVGLLILGSVIGALALNFPMLLAGRVLQSLGTGMLIPIGMNITLEVAPRQKLGTYMGIMGAMTTLGPSSSVIIAGVLLSFFHWKMLLWFFGALSLICFGCGAALLPNVAKLTYPRLDRISVLWISLALIGILYGISTIFEANLFPALGSLILGVLCLLLFLNRQKKIEDPLIRLDPLKIRPFALGVVINMLALMVIFAMNIVMPLFLQGDRGISAFGASMVLFPAILLSCAVSPAAGRVYDKRGGKTLLPLGFLFIACGALGLCATRSLSLPTLMAVLYIPVICGSALIIGPVQSFALSHLTPEQNPHGVTVMSTGFQIAGCIGSSVFTGVYGVCAAPDSGFRAVCLFAAALALCGVALAFKITRTKKAAGEEEKSAELSDHTIASLMERGVYAISDKASLLDAVRYMAETKVSGLPVIDSEQRIKGFIADGDISYIFQKDSNRIGFASMYPLWQNSEKLNQKFQELSRRNIMDCATEKVITVRIDDDTEALFRAFSDKRIKKVPVLEEGKVVGIVSRSDLFRLMIEEYGN